MFSNDTWVHARAIPYSFVKDWQLQNGIDFSIEQNYVVRVQSLKCFALLSKQFNGHQCMQTVYKYSWCETHVNASVYYMMQFSASVTRYDWLPSENNSRRRMNKRQLANNRNQTKRIVSAPSTVCVHNSNENMCNLLAFFTWITGNNAQTVRLFSRSLSPPFVFARYIFIYKSLWNRTKIFWKLHLCQTNVIIEIGNNRNWWMQWKCHAWISEEKPDDWGWNDLLRLFDGIILIFYRN